MKAYFKSIGQLFNREANIYRDRISSSLNTALSLLSQRFHIKDITGRGKYIHLIQKSSRKDEKVEVLWKWNFHWHIQEGRQKVSLRETLGYGTYDFEVIVKKLKSAQNLVFSCSSLMGGPLIIKEIFWLDEVKEAGEMTPLKLNIRRFSTLPSEVQNKMKAYLNERFVNDELCEIMARHSEQRGLKEDQLWAQKLCRFVSSAQNR